MQRYYFYILIFIIFISALAWPQSAASQTVPTVRVFPSQTTLAAGDSVTIQIWVDNVTDLRGFDVEVQFDQNLLLALDLSDGNFLSGSFYPPTNGIDSQNGFVRFGKAIQGNECVSDSGILFSFKLTAMDNSGISPIWITFVELVHDDYSLISYTLQHGEVIVGDGEPITKIFIPLMVLQ